MSNTRTHTLKIENAKQTFLLEKSMFSSYMCIEYSVCQALLLNKFKWRIRKFSEFGLSDETN